jgi:predicted TIM-barrel fold metal-dependent hydrolase
MTTTATATGATTFDYGVFDADNHYYEATDAYTRHIDPEFAKRAMQWAEIDGKRRLLVGGKVNRFIPNPLFDPVAKPGSLGEYFRGRNPGAKDLRSLFGDLEPIRPAYRDRDARLRVMDEQGLDGCLLFPTLGVGMEESLAGDPPALVAAFNAFNRWLEDDWGYAYKGRIFAAPMLTLINLDAAVAELQRVLDKDARVICIKAGPAHSANGLTSPADPRFDPFWSLVNESGVTVGIHSGDAGYGRYLSDWEPQGDFRAFRHSPLRTVLSGDRVPLETMGALVCHGLFDRFPRIRVASIESGASWVPALIKLLKKAYGQMPTGFTSDPIQTLREHVWVAPFYEDDLARLKDDLGVEHILFGSDWPHAEGLVEPRHFAEDLARHGYDDAEIRTVMADNGRPLVQRL